MNFFFKNLHALQDVSSLHIQNAPGSAVAAGNWSVKWLVNFLLADGLQVLTPPNH